MAVSGSETSASAAVSVIIAPGSLQQQAEMAAARPRLMLESVVM